MWPALTDSVSSDMKEKEEKEFIVRADSLVPSLEPLLYRRGKNDPRRKCIRCFLGPR